MRDPRATLPGLWSLAAASALAILYAFWLGGDIYIRWNYEDRVWRPVPPPNPLWLRVAWGSVLLALATAVFGAIVATVAMQRPSWAPGQPSRWARGALGMVLCTAALLLVSGFCDTFRATYDFRGSVVPSGSPLIQQLSLVAVISIVPAILAAVALGVHLRWRRLTA